MRKRNVVPIIYSACLGMTMILPTCVYAGTTAQTTKMTLTQSSSAVKRSTSMTVSYPFGSEIKPMPTEDLIALVNQKKGTYTYLASDGSQGTGRITANMCNITGVYIDHQLFSVYDQANGDYKSLTTPEFFEKNDGSFSMTNAANSQKYKYFLNEGKYYMTVNVKDFLGGIHKSTFAFNVSQIKSVIWPEKLAKSNYRLGESLDLSDTDITYVLANGKKIKVPVTKEMLCTIKSKDSTLNSYTLGNTFKFDSSKEGEYEVVIKNAVTSPSLAVVYNFLNSSFAENSYLDADGSIVTTGLPCSPTSVNGPISYTIKVAGISVKFNNNGHGTAPSTQTGLQTGSKVEEPANLTATDYAFQGWYKDKNFKEKWDFENDTVTADTTLYAKWVYAKDEAYNPVVKNTITQLLLAKATPSGKSSINVSWNKINGATKYIVYKAKCNTSTKSYGLKAYKTVSAKTLKATVKGLSKHTGYKLKVVAYNGSKRLKTSYVAHTFTTKTSGKQSAVKSVSVSKSKITLANNQKYAISSKINLYSGKTPMAKNHTSKFRYVSNCSTIASVNRYGTITAKSKGTCRVYVIGMNGAWKSIAVTVK